MNKLAFAIAAAAAVIPAASFAATPVPGTFTTGLTETYTLKCVVNSYSVEKSRNMILVVNTLTRSLPQGTKIALQITLRRGVFVHRTTRVETAYRDIAANTGSLTFSQPYLARSCTATVSLPRRVARPF